MYDVFAVVLIKLTKLQLLLWLAGQAGWLRQDGHLQEQGENSGGSVISARRDCCVCCALPDHSRISPHLVAAVGFFQVGGSPRTSSNNSGRLVFEHFCVAYRDCVLLLHLVPVFNSLCFVSLCLVLYRSLVAPKLLTTTPELQYVTGKEEERRTRG